MSSSTSSQVYNFRLILYIMLEVNSKHSDQFWSSYKDMPQSTPMELAVNIVKYFSYYTSIYVLPISVEVTRQVVAAV